MVLDSDVFNFYLLGGMSCEPRSMFFPILNQFVSDNNLVFTDIEMLHNSETYYSNVRSGFSLVDHAIYW